VRRLREGDMRMARALAVQALAHSCDDPFAAGAALLVAHATADAALVNDVDAAACWERVRRDGNVAAIAFFGGAYASTIGDAFAAREILEAVFRKTPPVAASIEALLAAAECGDRALAANVLARIATIAADAPPELRAVAAHAAALIGRTGDDAAGAHTAAIQAQRDYARAGWAYYAARAAELAGDARAAQSAYRRAGAVHLALAERFPGLLTIIVPRHPERGPDIATDLAVAAAPVEITRRAHHEDPPAAGIWVADTLGELGLFYRLAPIAFVGRSLTVGGGQNPIEPARLGCATCIGPLTSNFEEHVRILQTAGALTVVQDAGDLAKFVSAMLQEPERRAAMGQAGISAATGYAGLPDLVADTLIDLMGEDR